MLVKGNTGFMERCFLQFAYFSSLDGGQSVERNECNLSDWLGDQIIAQNQKLEERLQGKVEVIRRKQAMMREDRCTVS